MATTVLGLKTFTASDPVDYNEINDNYNKIDNGVKTAFQGRAAHNLLDNSDFRNPVNQRGQTTYTGSRHSIDRWRTWNNDATITLTSEGIKGDGTDASVLYQGIELHKIKLGTAYTVAAGYSDGTISCGAGTLTTSSSVGIWNSEAQVCLLWGDGSPFMRLWHATKTIQWAAIYQGSYTADTLPAYQPKGYAAELAECQRYYIIGRRYRPSVATFVDSTQSLMIFDVQLPQRMRIKPTATIKKYPSYIRINGQQYSFTDVVISATYYNKDENTIGIVLKCTSNFGSFMTGHFDEIAIEFSSEM